MADTVHEPKPTALQVDYSALPRTSILKSYETISTVVASIGSKPAAHGAVQNDLMGQGLHSSSRDGLSRMVFWSSGVVFVLGVLAIFMH